MEENKNRDSGELEIRLKGKSPEEIAEIVESYYRAKYEKEKLFTGRKYLYSVLSLVIFALLLALSFWLFFNIVAPHEKPPGKISPGKNLDNPADGQGQL